MQHIGRQWTGAATELQKEITMARDEDDDLYDEEFDFVDDEENEVDEESDIADDEEGENEEAAAPRGRDGDGFGTDREADDEPVDEYGRPEPKADYFRMIIPKFHDEKDERAMSFFAGLAVNTLFEQLSGELLQARYENARFTAIKESCRLILRDEARHIQFGRIIMRRFFDAISDGDKRLLGAKFAKKLRGSLLNGVYANNVQVYGRWRASEASEWMLTVAPSHFSDGNDRLEGGIAGVQRIYTAPHLKADLLVDLWSSRNSRTDVPYYSPRADLTVLPSARLTHTLYRRYGTAWEQQFLAGAGTYSQQAAHSQFGSQAWLIQRAALPPWAASITRPSSIWK